MSLETDIELHQKTHDSVWITSGKTAKVDGNVIELWYHVKRNSEEHQEYLAKLNF